MGYSYTTSLETLLETIMDAPGQESVSKTVVIRDLRGRLRLVLEMEGDSIDYKSLEKTLSDKLEKWFCGPILSTSSEQRDEARIARHLVELSLPWPSRWLSEIELPDGSRQPIDTTKLGAIESVHSKESWLVPTTGRPPWPLRANNPTVVSFYSFKGGVGRSTTLGVLAVLMARRGLKVVCVDLDLEAPGLASLFEIEDQDPGVLDALLSASATGSIEIEEMVHKVTSHDKEVLVIPAGRLDSEYIEKLARLDFLCLDKEAPTTGARSESPMSPVLSHLKQLLKKIKADLAPDFIFLDGRAGLHDLSGLVLNDLSHVDVIVGRSGRQGLAGMEATFALLAGRRGGDTVATRPLVLVHTHVPLPTKSEESKRYQESYRTEMYDRFVEYFWGDKEEDEVSPDDSLSYHFPWVLGRYDEIVAADTIPSLSLPLISSNEFERLADRLVEVSTPRDS